MTGSLWAWLWLIAPAGVCRATQILVHDDVLRRPRSRIVHQSHAAVARKLEEATPTERWSWSKRPWTAPYAYKAKLATCPWCVSIYVAALAVAGLELGQRVGWLRWLDDVTLAVLLLLALSLGAVAIDHGFDRFLPDDVTPEPGPAPSERVEPPAEVRTFLDSLGD